MVVDDAAAEAFVRFGDGSVLWFTRRGKIRTYETEPEESTDTIPGMPQFWTVGELTNIKINSGPDRLAKKVIAGPNTVIAYVPNDNHGRVKNLIATAPDLLRVAKRTLEAGLPYNPNIRTALKEAIHRAEKN